MLVPQSLFIPHDDHPESSLQCEFHMKGCCFDPKKKVRGFLAAPCFGCLELPK